MANTTADKLAKLNATKADLKAALAEKGQTVGDVFSTYPAAVRAIKTGTTIDKVKVTNNSSRTKILSVAYVDSNIRPIEIDAGSSYNNCVKGSIAFWCNSVYGASISGEYEDAGFIAINSKDTNYYQAFKLIGSCVFSDRGGG
ncbi:MAG: hypothetical protein MSB10_05760 [Clostridiales bacterium]|uniref:hypothetical protein n=1 Tax=Flavonifractor porci TaxID=3133422 RepID=UPI0030A5F288|nr:hypothetical protein [Clostridiales bacterium]